MNCCHNCDKDISEENTFYSYLLPHCLNCYIGIPNGNFVNIFKERHPNFTTTTSDMIIKYVWKGD